jgi:hypothetical protein
LTWRSSVLFAAGGQFGRLLIQPRIQFMAGVEELLPGGRVAVHGVTQPDIVDLAQGVLEVLGDAGAFGIDDFNWARSSPDCFWDRMVASAINTPIIDRRDDPEPPAGISPSHSSWRRIHEEP